MTSRRLNTLINNKNNNKTSALSTSSADCNLYQVPANQLNLMDYLYDEQTVLYVNSSINANSNTSRGVYTDKNFNSNSLLNQNTYIDTYSLDIANGVNNNPLFVGIGVDYVGGDSPLMSANYNSGNIASNYLVKSSYIFEREDKTLEVQLIVSINNSESLNVNGSGGKPKINLQITNKVISNDEKTKGVINNKNMFKQKTTLHSKFVSSTETSMYMNSNIPFIFAPGFDNVNIGISVMYVPPKLVEGVFQGQYLSQNGFVVSDSEITFNKDEINEVGYSTTYGHFVFGFSFNDNSYLENGINCDKLIKSIWRSPISTFNAYKNSCVSKMTFIPVVLLFGTNVNGSLFLALNTGTPISTITHYGVTTLENFINIMRAFIIEYDNNEQLVDYFINKFTVKILKEKGYDIECIETQSLIDTNTITNPSTVNSNPNMTYYLLHKNNLLNINIDTTEQDVVNKNIGISPLNLDEASYCSLGNMSYSKSNIKMLKTDNNNIFADTLNLGYEDIDGKLYNINIILPESGFRFHFDDNTTIANIYNTDNSAYYFSYTSFAERFNKEVDIVTFVSNNPKNIKSNRISLNVSNNVIF